MVCKDVDGNEIKVGDMVEIVDSGSNYSGASYLGLARDYNFSTFSGVEYDQPIKGQIYKLVGVVKCAIEYNHKYFINDQETAQVYLVSSSAFKKVNTNRHPHADLIHKWAEDTSLEVEGRGVGLHNWSVRSSPQWLLGTEYRIKPSKTPAELEKESILASIKELEENTATALSELQSKLKELEV